MHYTTSHQLSKNIKHFLNIKPYSVLEVLSSKEKFFYGWGRKPSGLQAIKLAQKHQTSFVLVEDGFICSLEIGTKTSHLLSIVKDPIGIYYDATQPSRLENILNRYNFHANTKLMQEATQAIDLMVKHNISKYNHVDTTTTTLQQFQNDTHTKVLIIAQTANDASLKYGMLETYTTNDMIDAAINENPNATIYLKIHPDVLSGKKASDIEIATVKSRCTIITENINPIRLLKQFHKVYTKTSNMGFEALLVGCECVCFGIPYYAGWGLTDDRVVCNRRERKLTKEEVFAGAYILYTTYYNPYSKKSSTILETLQTIVKYREIAHQNQGRLFLFGFSRWKRHFVKPFFHHQNNEILFCNTLKEAQKKNLSFQDKVLIWGVKENIPLLQYCVSQRIQVHRVEDGFIRSVSLGSDLTKPYSLVVDTQGIYFDPRYPNDLEELLQTYIFDETLKHRAKDVIETIRSLKLSKYNGTAHHTLHLHKKSPDQKVILIPGQVEDDASMRYGGMGMTTLTLLQEVREANPNALILFKPHPDVLSGNRVGLKESTTILQYADTIIKNTSIDSALNVCDEVHTITSTVGFDALIRHKKVFTYGVPFYANWGLTIDKHYRTRGGRQLTLYELVAATLILYPRYISPKTNTLCEVEVVLDEIVEMQNRYFNSTYVKTMIDLKTYSLRKFRRLIEFLIVRTPFIKGQKI
jgi:capsular polysaccharide export protein